MKKKTPGPAAFSLVEVTFALGVSAFCLIAIFALLPVGLKSNQTAAEQTAANGILSAVAADLRSAPQTVPPGQAAASQQFQIPVPQNPVELSPPSFTLYFAGDGTFSADRQAGSRYQLSAAFLPNTPSGGGNGQAGRAATLVKLRVSWPAGAASCEAAGSVETLLALDRN
ncbi:MAG: hypothetical protein PHQ12_04110 [Chthoniobacteraceae bacterium]|nr:hypothetical protein [Chthoniobacteraceae bacterium]